MKILVAMSGGVDSSVAAAILRQEGYEVIGATIRVWSPREPSGGAERYRGCFDANTVEYARRVADKLGIPHYEVDAEGVFKRRVIAEFCQEYSRGRTPNPCISCNRYVKFHFLMEKAREVGADYIATGHYARIEKSEDGDRYLLRKGVDRRKDQSYVLHRLSQEQIGYTRLPLGVFTKDRVRKLASELGLNAHGQESQDICFIPDKDYPHFIMDSIPGVVKPGLILDREGVVLGRHQGIMFYTVGQRKRLGISAKEPLYVTAIDPERNAIIVGTKKEASSRELIASRLNWIAIEAPEMPFKVDVKIRYFHPEAEAVIFPMNSDRVLVRFKEPQIAITPGQAVVFYREDIVLGGGIIETIT